MKNLIEYVNESLLDDEEDLLDNADATLIINFLAGDSKYKKGPKLTKMFNDAYKYLYDHISPKCKKISWDGSSNIRYLNLGDFENGKLYIYFNKRNDNKKYSKKYPNPELALVKWDSSQASLFNYNNYGQDKTHPSSYMRSFNIYRLNDGKGFQASSFQVSIDGNTTDYFNSENIEMYELPREYYELWEKLLKNQKPYWW